MRLTDLLTLPLAALWQQKTRTLLTTLGVVFGAFVLAASLSIGQGVQETIDRETHRSEISRRIDVSPMWNFGCWDFSSTHTLSPARAAVMAADAPPGPAPITMTS